METSPDGKAFIKRRESCRLSPHWDAIGGVWDIGYGHVLKDGEPRVAITQDEADALFDLDLRYREDAVNENVTVALSQGMFDALVSFVYNVGTAAFKSSTLLQYVNAAMYSDACVEMLTWNKAKGAFVDGLLNRRAREGLMFAREEYR